MPDSSIKKFGHVTIDMIEKLYKPDVGLVIHKQKFDMVALIGRVESINDQTVKCTFLINDGTSSKGLEILQWKSNENELNSPIIKINTYIRVFGQLRYQNGNIVFIAFKITPIVELNELTAHILSIIHDSILLRKIKLDYIMNRSIGNISNEFKTSANHNDGIFSSMSEAQKLILDTLKNTTREDGMSTDEITNALRSIDRRIIVQSLEFLMNEGHIFTTIDQDHFKNAYD